MADTNPAAGDAGHHEAVWRGFCKLMTYSTAGTVALLVVLGLTLL